MKATLGTQLRHLIELLDGAVDAAYKEIGLDYRPRYTPVMRALEQVAPCGVGRIAECAGITQPAATQTIALMSKAGLVSVTHGTSDARQRLIELTDKGQALLPQLRACWQATQLAADDLERELGVPLSEVLGSAIQAIEAKPFSARIAEARLNVAGDRQTNLAATEKL